jgi:hypothetical protein
MKRSLLGLSIAGILILTLTGTATASSVVKSSAASGVEPALRMSPGSTAIPLASVRVANHGSHYRCRRGYRLRGRRCYRRGRASRRATCARGYYGKRCSRKSTPAPLPPQTQPQSPAAQPQPPAAPPQPKPEPQRSLADWAYSFAYDDIKARSTIAANLGEWYISEAYIRNCHVNTSGTGQCDIWSRAWHDVCNPYIDVYCLPPHEAREWAWFLYNMAAVPTVIGIVPRVYNVPNGDFPHSYICSNNPFVTGVARCP